MVKNLLAVQETSWVGFLGWKDPLEKGMAIHSSILSWRIPRQRSLVCCSPWGHKELDMAEQLNNNNKVNHEWEENIFLKWLKMNI